MQCMCIRQKSSVYFLLKWIGSRHLLIFEDAIFRSNATSHFSLLTSHFSLLTSISRQSHSSCMKMLFRPRMVSIGTARMVTIEIPGTATQDFLAAICRTRRHNVQARTRIIVDSVPILAPFPYISAHVVQTERVGV